MSEFGNDPVSRKMVVDHMTYLVGQNQAASDLLFRAGILEMPFPIPRAMASQALMQAGWRPDEKTLQDVDERLAALEKLGDHQSIAGLTLFVARLGLKKQFDPLLRRCCGLIKEQSSQASDLLKALKSSYSQRAEEMLEAVVQAVNDADNQGYKSKDLARMVTDSLDPIPGAWVTEGALLRVSQRILEDSWPPRNTVIEFLWVDAVRTLRSESPRQWETLLETIGSEIEASGATLSDNPASSLFRYWFEAVGKLNEIDYLSRQAQSDNERWSIAALIQLFFITGGYSRASNRAQRALSDLKSKFPQRYRLAESNYEQIIGGSKSRTTINDISGPAGIRE
jgi:hypothetical protein